tara:strand:- start:84 stop:977 length:894 start_codon:yes stop_codon:yes gene_type:complete
MKSKILFSSGAIGIILMMGGQLSFSLNDSFVKLAVIEIGIDTSIFSIIFTRGCITTMLLGLYLIIFEKKNLFAILKIKKFHIRGLYEVLTAIFFFTALIYLPISEVYTLLMTNPFFVTIFAFLFLKEKVGIRRWGAVIIGFIGVLVVINPQNFSFNYLFILPIISAIFLTIRDIATKTLATKNNSVEITFITALLITFFAGVGSILFGYEVTFNQTRYILISSVFVLFGYLFSVMTVFYAPLSLTASARYSVIIFGIILGYLILGEIPNVNMIFGAIIIASSGLFIIKREKDIGKIN